MHQPMHVEDQSSWCSIEHGRMHMNQYMRYIDIHWILSLAWDVKEGACGYNNKIIFVFSCQRGRTWSNIKEREIFLSNEDVEGRFLLIEGETKGIRSSHW